MSRQSIAVSHEWDLLRLFGVDIATNDTHLWHARFQLLHWHCLLRLETPIALLQQWHHRALPQQRRGLQPLRVCAWYEECRTLKHRFASLLGVNRGISLSGG
jgi:hypothetical protein